MLCACYQPGALYVLSELIIMLICEVDIYPYFKDKETVVVFLNLHIYLAKELEVKHTLIKHLWGRWLC